MFKILEDFLYVQKPSLNAHAEDFSGAKCLNFNLSIHLHPYFVYVSREGSEETHRSLHCSPL